MVTVAVGILSVMLLVTISVSVRAKKEKAHLLAAAVTVRVAPKDYNAGVGWDIYWTHSKTFAKHESFKRQIHKHTSQV